MSPRKSTEQPTEGELEILQILWDAGSATVREVCEVINERRAMGYTTALKLMQIMFEKGMVIRDESNRTHRYAAAVSKAETRAGIVGNMIDKAFGGSAHDLVVSALGSASTSDAELRRIQELIAEARKKLK